jgi:hypothetical protein
MKQNKSIIPITFIYQNPIKHVQNLHTQNPLHTLRKFLPYTKFSIPQERTNIHTKKNTPPLHYKLAPLYTNLAFKGVKILLKTFDPLNPMI